MTPFLRRHALPRPPLLAMPLIAAAHAFGRLAQALHGHPLLPAIRYRARLEAARRAAAVDGQAIDPWHLAALLAGLRPRLDGARIADRGDMFAAARHALAVHRWLADPDFDQEGEIQRADAALAAETADPFTAAASALRTWVEAGKSRMAMRAALIRHWHRRALLPAGVPVFGAASLAAGEEWDPEVWLPAFLGRLANEADEIVNLTRRLDQAWHQARQAVQGRRPTSHAPALIDLLAAAPLLSSPAAAAALAIAPKNAIALLQDLAQAGIIIEVSQRAKRQLYALPHLAPLRDGVAAPRRPEPFRSRGRPRLEELEEAPEPFVPSPPPIARVEMRAIDINYGNLEQAMAELDDVIRRTHHALLNIGTK